MNLGSSAARSGVWMVAANAAGQGVFFVVFAILARMLDKPDFGLVAYAAVFSGFFGVFLRLGYGDALVQLKEITPAHTATAFWTSSGAGLAMGLACVAAAYPIGAVLEKPELTPLVQALSISCVFIGLRTVPAALLTRDLRFAAISTVTLASNVVGGMVGVAMAFSGWGVWALVGQRLSIELMSLVMMTSAAGYRPPLVFDPARLKELTGFSNHVFKLNLITYADQYVDQFLVGYFLGDVKLGVYTVARRLTRTLATVVLNALARVSFPAFSKLQHDPARAAEAVYRSTGMIVLLAYPLLFGIIAFAPDVVRSVFGEKWIEVAPLVQLLCVEAAYGASMSAFAGACKGMGKPEHVTKQRSIAVGLNVLLFLLVYPYGLEWVAAAYCLRAFLLHPLQMHYLHDATGLSYQRFYAALVGPLLVSLASVAAASAAVLLLPAGPVWQRLAVAGAVIVVVQAALVLRLLPQQSRAILNLIRRS